ncbi:MAG: ACP S-malonyltransferase [Solirubrobacteraceae bacterium]
MIAALFPGQGSQTAHMREALERARPDLLELCLRELGSDPFERLGEGTHMAQPAIYCASLAGYAAVADARPALMAGHSLGELAALVAAGAMSELDGLRVVIQRGRLMHQAGGGGMLAVSASPARAAELAHMFGLALANDNSPRQVVLSGNAQSIAAAAEHASGESLRALRLPVAGAFHSPAMACAADGLRDALADIDIVAPRVPVLSCVTAEPFDDVRARLVESLTSPVRWREVVLHLQRAGVTSFIEVGAGGVLSGLVRKTIAGADARPIEAELQHA